MTLAVLTTAALFGTAGLPLTLLLNSLRRRSLLLRLAYAYPLGVAFIGFALFAASHIAGVPLRRTWILVFAGLPTAVLFAGRAVRAQPLSRDAGPPSTSGGHARRIAALLALTVAAPISFAVLLEAGTDPVKDWDGRAMWGAEARYVREARSVDAPGLGEPAWTFEVLHHPLLLPLAQVAVQEVLDASDDDRAIRPIYALFLPSFLGILFHQTSLFTRHAAAPAMATVCAALLPVLVFRADGGASGCYSDLPLACFWGTGALLLAGASQRRSDRFVAALLLGSAVLTKDEGLPLALIAISAALCRSIRAMVASLRRAGRRALPGVRRALEPAAFVLLAALLLHSWRAGLPSRFDPKFVESRAMVLLEGFTHRYPAVLLPILDETQNVGSWGYAWLAWPIVVFAGRASLRRRPAVIISIATAATLALYLSVYATTSLNPFWTVRVTWDRFLVQLALPLSVLFGIAFDAASRPVRRWGPATVGAFAVLLVLALFLPLSRLLGVSFRVLSGTPPSAAERLPSQKTVPAPPEKLALVDSRVAEDGTCPASIDEPPPDAMVKGPLVLKGWGQDSSGPCEIVDILVDGRRRAPSAFSRVPRPDVAAALPHLGSCDRAGYEAPLEPGPDDAGAHELRVRFLSPDGKVRSLARRFTWIPAAP